MSSRTLRYSFLLFALLFVASCSSGDTATDEGDAGLVPIDDTGLIATFDVGYEVPLDIPEELQNRNDERQTELEQASNDGLQDQTESHGNDETQRGERVISNDPPDELPMADEEAEGRDVESTDSSDDDSSSESGEGGSESAWPDDPNLRADGLLYARSPVIDGGRWKSIALIAPDGEVVWAYNACDDSGCTHDDIVVLPNGNVAVTATSTVDGRLVDNVFELEPVIGEACATDDWCTGIARQSRIDQAVPDGSSAALSLLGAASDYSSWDVLSLQDGSTLTIPAA